MVLGTLRGHLITETKFNNKNLIFILSSSFRFVGKVHHILVSYLFSYTLYCIFALQSGNNLVKGTPKSDEAGTRVSEDTMKIKKVSILGFKSFMDRLDIAFPGGISGVVGPNGCGKSNIVDAIRWCMGEQSPKQLRGRRMEDVIFSGAGDYKPMGMAEVSITFENGGGRFPPAFAQDSELSVTRRLYRSGESEYLINNIPCRLKDIQEIFMDTGLGNKAYSIISQGQIGTILEQKPEDTRVMLEEAAGVTKYRKKVEAAGRKIGLAEANLQRVEDILREVQGQMRSLKRQASKAKRYKRICQEIQNLELILYANTYRELKEESGSRLRSTEDLVEQELAKSTELSRVNAQIETMQLGLEEKDSGLSAVREKHLRLRDRVHRKEAGIETLKGELNGQEELEQRLREEQEEIRGRLAGLEREKENLAKRLGEMKQGSNELQGEISLKDKRVSTRRELLKEIRGDYEEARAELNANANKEMGLNHESGYLNKMLRQVTDSRSRVEKEIEEVKANIENIVKASERKSLAREAASERLREIEASIDHQNMDLEELEETKRGVETELKSVETEFNMSQSRLASLQAMAENFDGYKIGVRTIMKAQDLTPQQQGRILGLVADIIQVDPKYEQAVEAVLADKLQYVIVETQRDGKEAIDYLKKRGRGRSSFIPVNDLNGDTQGKMNVQQLPLLLEFVSVPQKYRPLINALLGNTVLVKDLDEAVSAWKSNGKDSCFVTLDGDMVDERGVISGGRLIQGSHGLLVRKREIVELKEKNRKYRKIVDDLRLKVENSLAQIQEKKRALEDLIEGKWSCQDEVNEFDKALFRLGQELDQLEKLHARLTNDLEKSGTEEKRHKRELSRIEEELHRRKAKRRLKEEYFQEKENELKEAEDEFEQFREELTRLKADYRILEEEQRGVTREIERLEDFADESLKRLRKIEEDIALGRRRRDECWKRKEAVEEELKEIFEELRLSEQEVNRAEQERQVFQDNIREQEGMAEQLRREIETLKDTINRAKMEQSEIQFKMDSLGQMVKEKFNMSLPDIYEQYLEEGFSQKGVEEKIEQQKALRERIGDVNLTAIRELEALKERHEFIKGQREDLINSIESLRTAIRKINKTSLIKFNNIFQEVDHKLKEIFPILFGGGTAGLRLTDESKPLESGVLVEVKPPGKRLSHMGLLSGGEKAMVAMALLFAIYMIKPSPFCLLDEVDAPLDEANIDRFNDLLKEIKKASQIIMVTHSRRTMEITDRLYGITMERAGISKSVSVDIQSIRDHLPEWPQDDLATVH